MNIINKILNIVTRLENEPMYADYRKNYCSKNMHFVGAISAPACEACGKIPHKTKKGWQWK